ncbi:hypothetical protein [Xylophilus sp. ASV27]|nr:hypothetical protein [Xylophilus sp. ASV27]
MAVGGAALKPSRHGRADRALDPPRAEADPGLSLPGPGDMAALDAQGNRI